MHISKDELIASIVSAKGELDQALTALEALPAFDPRTVGYAAHAIGDYLAIAAATVDLVQSALASRPDAEVQNWLERLRQGTVVVEHTVNQLINASAAAEPQYVFGAVNVVRLARSGCDYYQAVAARKQIRIVFASAVERAYVRTDRCAVATILDNLLSNAVKYSEHGKRIRVIVAEGPDHVACHVEDEGPGLSDEEQVQALSRGIPLSPTTAEASTGLGLPIAKQLVNKLGGKIWCESSLGHGARFSFSLPTEAAQRVAWAAPAARG